MTVVKDIKNDVQLDDVLIKLKLNGRYHMRILVLIFLFTIVNNMLCHNFVFTAEAVGYRCKDKRFENFTCSYFYNSSEICTEWEYDDPHSFVADFQLACQDWKRTLVGTVHQFGYAIGLPFIGSLSDRFGRKSMFVITVTIGGILGVLKSFTTWYWMFIALDFLGAAFGDAYSPAFMLVMEMVAHEKRVLFKHLCCSGTSFGYMTLSLLAWLFPHWRHLLRVIYTPALFYFFYAFLLDESPRWLLSKGEKEKALAVLQKAAKRNKLELDKGLLENISVEENKEISFIELLKRTFTSGVLLRRTLLCVTWWIASTFVHFGLKVNSVLLPGNKYINYGLLTVVNLPATIMITFVLMRFRRKLPLLCSFSLAAVICFAQPFIPPGLPWLSILLFMAGTIMASAFFNTTYIFTSEVFPTYTRNSMHAFCSSMGRIGSMLAPQTPLLMVYWHGLPSLVFGLVSLLAGIATLFAPDTADVALPDTVTQAEALGGKPIPTGYKGGVTSSNTSVSNCDHSKS